MVWRSAYTTRVTQEVPLPSVGQPTDILVGAFDFAALKRMAIWRKLAQADAPQYQYLEAIFLSNPGPADQELLEAIVPPSLQPSTLLVGDPSGAWRDLIQAETKDECFAAAVRDGNAVILIKGLPTEEAWDAFLEALRA